MINVDFFSFLKIKRDDITVKTIKEPTTGQNSILVTITGSCAGEEENVILGAHLDSIANVEFPDMSEDDPAPSLDDDGSGVMVLFEILRVIVETGYKPHKNVQIMAYASEEVGLLGSDQIAENYESEGKYKSHSTLHMTYYRTYTRFYTRSRLS